MGWFQDEIIPVDTIIKDKDGNEKPARVKLSVAFPLFSFVS